jgi:hypothetical protein
LLALRVLQKKSPAAEKLNLRTRAEIVRFASAQGWLEEL